MKSHEGWEDFMRFQNHEISRRLRSFSVSGKSVLQPSTNFQHHRAEEASCVRWPPPSAFRPHTLHCRLPGTSWQMCILICDATLPWPGRIPTHEVSMSLTASCFSTNKSLKRKKKKCCRLSASSCADPYLSKEEQTNICSVTDHSLCCSDLVPALPFILTGTTINSK